MSDDIEILLFCKTLVKTIYASVNSSSYSSGTSMVNIHKIHKHQTMKIPRFILILM